MMKNFRDAIRDGAVLAAVVLASATLAAAEPEPKGLSGPLPVIDKASWIWSAPSNDVCQIRTTFTLDKPPDAASILITAATTIRRTNY